jgi:tRNA nucleotidyltransferase/poly(A) polymerase
LENKILRCVNTEENTFTKDPSRFIRAIRFKVKLDLRIVASLHEYIMANGYDKIAEKYWSKDIEKFLSDEKLFVEGITELYRYGLLKGQANPKSQEFTEKHIQDCKMIVMKSARGCSCTKMFRSLISQWTPQLKNLN